MKRIYVRRSLTKSTLQGQQINKVKFQVTKISHLHSFTCLNGDIEKFMSPLAASRIYAAEQKVICGGKRHLIELDMETGFYKDVSLSISLVSN